MPSRAAYSEQPRFTSAGGLNLLPSPDALPTTAFPDLGNVHIGAGARIRTRRGVTLSTLSINGNTSASPKWLEAYAVEDTGYHFKHATSQLLFLNGVCVRSTTWATGGAALSPPIFGYGAPSTLARLRRPYAVNFVDTVMAAPASTPGVVAVFGHRAPYFIRSSNNAITQVAHTDWVTSFPTTVASYAGRVWYAGSDDYPARIWATNVGSATQFTVSPTPQPSDSFFLDLDLVDGGRIVGMQHLYDILLVFTTHGIYRISPQSTGATVPFKSNFISTHSCYSQHAIIKVDNGVVFMSQSGVYSAVAALTYGDVQFYELSAPIAPVFDSLRAWQLAGAFMTYDPVHYQVLVFLDHNYPFAHVSALTPLYTQADADADVAAVGFAYSPGTTECFVYDMRGKSWSRRYYPFHIRYAVNRAEPDGTRVTDAYDFIPGNAAAGNTVTTVHEYFLDDPAALDDAGTPIESYVRSKQETFDTLARRKHHVFLECEVEAGAPQLSGIFDSGAPVQAATLAAGHNRTPLRGSGRRVQVEWYSPGGMFELAGYSFDLGVGNRR